MLPKDKTKTTYNNLYIKKYSLKKYFIQKTKH